MQHFNSLAQVSIPPTGWIKAIRLALGMSMRQLGARLSITRQAVLDIEKREQEGGITLKALREVADAMGMDLVYGLVPREGSLDAYVEKRATEVASQIVQRTATSMHLEAQGNAPARIDAAIKERTEQLKREIPGFLWD